MTSDETRTVYARLRDAFSKTSADDCHRLAERVRNVQIDKVLRAISAHADECGRETYKPNVKRIAEIALRTDAPPQQTIPTPSFADIIRKHEPRATTSMPDWEVIVRYYRNQVFRGLRSLGDGSTMRQTQAQEQAREERAKLIRAKLIRECTVALVSECEVPTEIAATCGSVVLSDEQSLTQALWDFGQSIAPTPDPFAQEALP